MFIIDENTSREDILTAIYSDLDCVDAFIKADLDPETMPTNEIREFVAQWVMEGDECAAA